VSYFAGIDGGGTQTTCIIADENNVLGIGNAAGSNPVRMGDAKAREALGTAIAQGCAVAGITPQQLTSTCVGLSGAGRPEVQASMQHIMGDLVGGRVQLVGDMIIALAAAFGNGPGIVVISGTGSIAFGRDAQQQTARAGGWGFAVSDEGSGHWIGRNAVSAALRTRDEGRDSQLFEAILKAWKLSSQEQLILTANASPAPDFANLLTAVLTAAEAGDGTARGILIQAGMELAALSKIVVRRLFAEAGSIPVAMAGGVFHRSPTVRQAFYNTLRSEYPHTNIGANPVEPVRGALEIARKAALSAGA
jgi:N-acetylglucosamine kinase-like BadF-type ATPase